MTNDSIITFIAKNPKLSVREAIRLRRQTVCKCGRAKPRGQTLCNFCLFNRGKK